jgi:hypothetical protein
LFSHMGVILQCSAGSGAMGIGFWCSGVGEG